MPSLVLHKNKVRKCGYLPFYIFRLRDNFYQVLIRCLRMALLDKFLSTVLSNNLSLKGRNLMVISETKDILVHVIPNLSSILAIFYMQLNITPVITQLIYISIVTNQTRLSASFGNLFYFLKSQS